MPIRNFGIFLNGFWWIKLNDIVDMVGDANLNRFGFLFIGLQSDNKTRHMKLLVKIPMILNGGLKLYLFSLYQLVYPHVYFLS